MLLNIILRVLFPITFFTNLIENRNVKNSTLSVSANDKDPDSDPHGSPLVGLSGSGSGTLVKEESQEDIKIVI